ncbi:MULTISPECIES: SDR family NAD(P)-dependent oxidoreductase [Brevundimonas]|uniref:SDR family NAD(P)-dependent oxidoreductase n=1 Tax=Brevundimonas TaxID=41275 RepID=UPI0019078DE7|nr:MULTISPECIES: SDR family NAD(P)-dependent oxidoreductase [Brevundimonas]MDA0743927.1 SDR family NAD(P)-dependent oxidoreductase [Pseudomonadota bacterium]MBK1968474.1 SDR family NAD(P)-dependent oxidoreductase [Brevundimonas diminuta]MBK1976246.1 SDR family NAD(P)-dependent oxidoreductase [Brevundimonas diminuta]MDA1322025.1 SDR family NAD(P)-dependent oxidoreductase [Pseudomonadota bacterium]MDM8353658.1 SDR family NAD(P)-dependent oxidoreductase [Brevundimonas diminuta]
MGERVAAITGGHGTLGRAVVEAVQAAGWTIAVIDHASGHAVPEGVLEIGGVDLTDPAQARGAIEAVVAHYGRLDALLNIAGGFIWSPVEGDGEEWDRMHALNVKTTLNASRAALPHLKASPEGRIVNVGANGAVKAGHGMGAYAASKAGVHRLTEALAEELKSTSVTVNAVLPSIIDTAANRADMPGADPAKWVAPADLAAVILFLASPEARAVTGALIPVTGKV